MKLGELTSASIDEEVHILAVEDSKVFQGKIWETLGTDYQLSIVSSAEAGLKLLATRSFDLILLDVMLPGMNGLEMLPLIREIPGSATTPVIIMTSLENIEHKMMAFDAGASDYILKPYHEEEVRMRVKMQLELSSNRRYLKVQKTLLEKELRARTEEALRTREASISALAALAETRDNDTGTHIFRTMAYMELLVRKMLDIPSLRDEFSGCDPDLIVRTTPLHDIGKVGIPDAILLKPGPLDSSERAVMETHTTLGADALKKAASAGGDSEYLSHAHRLCISHHERWDGTGYPRRLSGKAIPLEGRLMAVCDVYDALISHRIYKKPMSHKNAAAIMESERGTQFDPDILDVFHVYKDNFLTIALNYAEHDDERAGLLAE